MTEQFLQSLLREKGPFYLMDLLRDLSEEKNTYYLAATYSLSRPLITALRSDGFRCLRFVLEEMQFASLVKKRA